MAPAPRWTRWEQRLARAQKGPDPVAAFFRKFNAVLPWILIVLFFLVCVRGMFWATRLVSGRSPVLEYGNPRPNRPVSPQIRLQ